MERVVALLPEVIKFPQQESEFRQLADSFYKYGYPNVIGAIDGSGIQVKVPAIDKNDFWTYKYGTYVNLTAVCDAEKRFLNINVGQSERNHDSHIFRCSPLAKMILLDGAIPAQYHIVADAAYGLHTNIMIPYPGRELSVARQLHNTLHSSTRMVIERAFGDLKNRWLRLHSLRCDVGTAVRVIAVCCILHNICIDSGDITPTEIPPMSGCHVLCVTSASSKRDDITQHLQLRRA